MGFFFKSDGLAADCNDAFDALREISYRWGSPEWLELRRQLMDQSGVKSTALRNQRLLYKTLRATGTHWLF
jgi:putative cardiolipin synthase